LTDSYEVLIAGGGIAGLSAGMTAARRGRKTMILTGGVPGGHLISIERIEGYPGFPEGVSGYELCPMVQEQATDAGAEFATGELQNVTADTDGYRIATSEGEYHAHSVILATGTHLRELGVPGETQFRGKGVSHCASCDAPLLRGRDVIVIGAGDSAMQEALTLAESASQVTILHRGTALSGQATYRERIEAQPNIVVRYNTSVQEITGDDAVTGVRLLDLQSNDASELEAAGVFVFIGMEPNTACLDGQLELDAERRIPVDGQLRTALKGIFAAGIVRAGSRGQAVCSAADGTAAAISADAYLHNGQWEGTG
jgi:thioredoxin reductase (NADPH)